MVAFNKFQDFVGELGLGNHDLNTHTCKVGLSNTQPVNTNSVWGDITEIGTGNGYTAGGEDSTNTYSESTGTGTMQGTKVVWTAGGGSIGPFQYVVLYNDTQTSPVKPLIGWWDHGSAVTLNSGETYSVKFNNSDAAGDILTIA
jgi:hypothetical protein